MVNHPVWATVMYGADFQVTFEFAERFLHVQQPLVMTQDLLARALLDRFIGVEQIPPVLLGFLGDQFGFAFPLHASLRVNEVGKILVGLESLQSSSHLAGQLLAVYFLALYRRHPF